MKIKEKFYRERLISIIRQNRINNLYDELNAAFRYPIDDVIRRLAINWANAAFTA
jgi:hypothetical protein